MQANFSNFAFVLAQGMHNLFAIARRITFIFTNYDRQWIKALSPSAFRGRMYCLAILQGCLWQGRIHGRGVDCFY